jgi:hypothetical protein
MQMTGMKREVCVDICSSQCQLTVKFEKSDEIWNMLLDEVNPFRLNSSLFLLINGMIRISRLV